MNNKVQDSRGRGLSDEMIARLLLDGDITGLSEYERVTYYKKVCERVGLDPSTQPFSILELKKKKKSGNYEPRTVLYLNSGGAAQLNRLHKVSHEYRDERISKNIYRIFYRASLPDGGYTDSAGVVSISGLSGDDLSNAIMRCETKAKRRSTVDLLGLAAFDGAGGAVPVMESDQPPPPQDKEEVEQEQSQEQTESRNTDTTTDTTNDVGHAVFKFGWNKGQAIKDVYAKRGEKEITGAIAWCEQNGKFNDFVNSARAFLETVEARPENATVTDGESAYQKKLDDDSDDLPF